MDSCLLVSSQPDNTGRFWIRKGWKGWPEYPNDGIRCLNSATNTHARWPCDIHTDVMSSSSDLGVENHEYHKGVESGVTWFPVVVERVPVINSLPLWMDNPWDVFTRYFHMLEHAGRLFERPTYSISTLITPLTLPRTIVINYLEISLKHMYF